ncbi:hypothetical protein Hanom_Chr09g00815551 [Helianthus anomalus]
MRSELSLISVFSFKHQSCSVYIIERTSVSSCQTQCLLLQSLCLKMAINDGLLEQVYHENCPGCKVERDKRIRTGYPIKELISIWVVVLCVGEHIYSLFIS